MQPAKSKGPETEPRALQLEDDLENRGASKGDRRSSGRGQRRANVGNALEAKRSKVHPVFLRVPLRPALLGAGAALRLLVLVSPAATLVPGL